MSTASKPATLALLTSAPLAPDRPSSSSDSLVGPGTEGLLTRGVTVGGMTGGRGEGTGGDGALDGVLPGAKRAALPAAAAIIDLGVRISYPEVGAGCAETDERRGGSGGGPLALSATSAVDATTSGNGICSARCDLAATGRTRTPSGCGSRGGDTRCACCGVSTLGSSWMAPATGKAAPPKAAVKRQGMRV